MTLHVRTIVQVTVVCKSDSASNGTYTNYLYIRRRWIYDTTDFKKLNLRKMTPSNIQDRKHAHKNRQCSEM